MGYTSKWQALRLWWGVFDERGAPPGKACCMLRKPGGKICGEPISTATPTNLGNHVMYKHPDDYIKLAPEKEPLDLQAYKPNPQQVMNAISAKQRDALHKAHARWLCKRKRPLSLPERLLDRVRRCRTMFDIVERKWRMAVAPLHERFRRRTTYRFRVEFQRADGCED